MYNICICLCAADIFEAISMVKVLSFKFKTLQNLLRNVRRSKDLSYSDLDSADVVKLIIYSQIVHRCRHLYSIKKLKRT